MPSWIRNILSTINKQKTPPGAGTPNGNTSNLPNHQKKGCGNIIPPFSGFCNHFFLKGRLFLWLRINGKRQYKVVYGKTEKEVEKKVREIKNQLDRGINIVESSTPFADCVKKWLSTMKFQTSESQYNLYEYRISVFVERLGNYPLRHIKPENLQAVLNDIAVNNPTTKNPSSYKTVLNYKNTVQMFYKYLTDNRYIDFDSSKALTIPKQAVPKKDRRALTAEEQNRVRTFKHRAQLPAMIAMLCGLRRGEISALKWSDIDFKEKTITVSKSFDFKNNKVKLPKTAAGIRTVPMPEELIQFLKRTVLSSRIQRVVQ